MTTELPAEDRATPGLFITASEPPERPAKPAPPLPVLNITITPCQICGIRTVSQP
jgi:hypothetical protein